MSGDLTVYGKRNSIMIIRENEGIRTIEKVDITKRDFMTSPYYYLAHNDIIYVEPNKTKINSSAIGPNVSIIVSILSLLTTILFLVIK
jgi:polysaccharide export outer membrane protein